MADDRTGYNGSYQPQDVGTITRDVARVRDQTDVFIYRVSSSSKRCAGQPIFVHRCTQEWLLFISSAFVISRILNQPGRYVLILRRGGGRELQIFGFHFYPGADLPFATRVQLHKSKMRTIVGLLALLELLMLVAGWGEATLLHSNLNNRELYAPTNVVNGQTWTYIIHMENSLADSMGTFETARSKYIQLLQSMKQDSSLDSNDELPTLPLHIYSTVCHGFSARLTYQEAAILRQMNGVLGVNPDKIRSLDTTRSPEFLGLSGLKGLWPKGNFGDDVIIGVLDTGVWPERKSFSDVGLGPIPAH